MEGEHGGLALRVISALWPLGQKQFSPPEIYLSSIYVCECTRVCVCVYVCVHIYMVTHSQPRVYLAKECIPGNIRGDRGPAGGSTR
jgi:hypothetical protein